MVDISAEYHASGSGCAGTVVALHSLGVDQRSFAAFNACLPAEWRLVTVDLPGHGAADVAAPQSWAQWVDSLLRTLQSTDLGRFHLLGHSLGGALAAEIAARMPGQVLSLTLIATPPQGMAAFAARADMALSEGMASAVETTLQRWFGEQIASEHAAAGAYAQRCLQHMSPESFAASWRAFARFPGYASLAPRLPRTLLISAEQDASTPPSRMAEIAQMLAASPASARHKTIAGAGHMVVLTHAAAVAELALAHWQHTSLLRDEQQ